MYKLARVFTRASGRSSSNGGNNSDTNNQQQANKEKWNGYRWNSTTSSTSSRSARRRANRNRSFALAAAIVGTGFVVFKGIELLTEWLDNREIPEKKEKIVILGSGWAAFSMLQEINRMKYDVTVISPRNYFLFTPMLSSAAVGSIDAESIMEPLREIADVEKYPFTFLEASALDIDPKTNTVSCKMNSCDKVVNVEYDRLVMAVGASQNDLKIKGANNALSLKDYQDARAVRNRIVDCLESASAPGTTDEEKKRMLHFVVVGGSPFAVEFAAELQGYLSHIKPMFPGLSDFTKVTLVESQDHINNYYDKNISSAMRKRFITEDVNVIPSKSLAEVGSNFIAVKEVDDNGKETISKIPCGMTVWGTGIAAHPLVEKLRKKLPHQNNARALVTNPSLVVLGTENVYAIGDCATIDQGALLARWEDVFKTADADGSGTIDLKEFENLVHTLARRYPAIREVAHRAEELFAIHDVDKSGGLSEDEFKNVLQAVERQLTRFPSTATVAVQQGRFLAKVFNKIQPEEDDDDKKDDDKKSDKDEKKDDKKADKDDKKDDKDDDDDDDDEDKPVFRYKHVGGYEYVGAEDGFVERGSRGTAIVTGPGAVWLWRSVYFSKLLDVRIRSKIWYNYIYYRLFGHTATRL